MTKPIKCPWFSMARPNASEYVNCQREECGFWKKDQKECCFPGMSMAIDILLALWETKGKVTNGK